MYSIIQDLEKNVNTHPNKLLYAFLDIKGEIKESYTYQAFYNRTSVIAGGIYENSTLKSGDRVLLAYLPGLEMICAFFSCVRLGLIPVPVYPPSPQGFQSSIQKMGFIAKDCGAKAVLTSRSYYWSVKLSLTRKDSVYAKPDKTMVSKLKWIMTDDFNAAEPAPFPESHSEILFLQYTSGSTSDPKGVMVTHDNIKQNCDHILDHTPIGVSWLPQYHDMGLIGYYLFFAIKGGTTYGFSPLDFMQRPALWLETISKYQATASSAPNFAFDYCLLPDKIPQSTLDKTDLRSLRVLMTAAEPVNAKTYQKFLNYFAPYGLKEESFSVAYGLAEFTLAVTNYGRSYLSVDAELLKQHKIKQVGANTTALFTDIMSCGKALGDTKIKIVSPSENKELKEGEVGEIWLNGTSKAQGYWGRNELSLESFSALLDHQNSGDSWLKTGDLGFLWNNELYVCGRLKDMIIIRGQNYYPQDIEHIIEQDSLVRKGCVAAFSIEKNGQELLVAVVGQKSAKSMIDVDFINKKTHQYFGIKVDVFVFVPARTVAKTSSGKIMRHLNKQRFINQELSIIQQVDCAHGVRIQDQNNAVLEDLDTKNNCSELFAKYHLTGSENNAFGDAGLDSLRLAEFFHDMKDFLKHQGFDDLSQEADLKLVQKIAVSELFQILSELKSSSSMARYRFKHAFAVLAKEHEQVELDMMRRDSHMKLPERKQKSTPVPANAGILLTGGTGFFGPFIVKSLLEQTKDDVYVIVRAENKQEGKIRLKKAFDLIDAPEELVIAFDKRVFAVCGDIACPHLDLNTEDWTFLSHNIHTIYHNGALVNYLLDYESMRNANVTGTIEMIRLALEGCDKVLNHISTTFIFGWSVKDTLFETDANDVMENLDFGYSQSKWVSEQLVKRAMKQGLNARIFRPALISPSINGKGFNFDISIRLLAFMVKNGLGTTAGNQISFTPANLGANNMVAICNIPESVGQTCHLTREVYSSMLDVTNILSILSGKSFQNFSSKAFVPEVVKRCTKNDILFPLLNFLVKSEEKISAMEFKRYDNSNYVKYRNQSAWGIPDAPLEEVVLGIYRFMKHQNII